MAIVEFRLMDVDMDGLPAVQVSHDLGLPRDGASYYDDDVSDAQKMGMTFVRLKTLPIDGLWGLAMAIMVGNRALAHQVLDGILNVVLENK